MIKAFVSMLSITLIIVVLPLVLPPYIPQYILNNVIYVTLLRVPVILAIVILSYITVSDIKRHSN